MILYTLIPGIIFVLVFIIVRIKKGGFPALILKIVSSIFFILTGLVAIYETSNYNYGVFIIIALIFGLLGDILLDLKWMYPKDNFLFLGSGFASFTIGHIAFLISLLLFYKFDFTGIIFAFILAGIVAILVIVVEKPLNLKYGKFLYVNIFYGFFLTFVTVYSGFTVLKLNPLFFVGLVLFLLSDMILCMSYFGEDKNTAPMIASNHLLYYGAQYLIGISILFYNL